MLRLFSAIITFLFLSCSGSTGVSGGMKAAARDCPIKSGNDGFLLSCSGSTGASEKQDIKWWIARSSRAMTEREKCRAMIFHPVMFRLDRSILKRDNRSRRQIARSSRAMTERGKYRAMTERGERREMMLRGAGDDRERRSGNDVEGCGR